MPSLSREQRQKMKQEYGWFYEALVQLLAKDDPMNLVRTGAPFNEYEPEVDMILSKLDKAESPSELGKIIYETFVYAFGTVFASRGEQSYKDYQPRFKAVCQGLCKMSEPGCS